MTPRVLREWRNRVEAEYRSAALTAQVAHWSIQVGLDDPLVRTALRIVGDELDHADLSHDAWVALGGVGGPTPVEVETLAAPPSPDGVLAGLLDAVTRDFCLGETLAVPLFAAIRAETTHPAARLALDRILRDEVAHRAFGWDALDALVLRDPDAARARIAARLPGWLSGFESAYADRREAPPLDPAERAAGLLDLSDYHRVFWDTVRGTLSERFGARGIRLPPRWAS